MTALGSDRVVSLLEGEGLLPRASVPAPDVALVGMGADGHIASLFPGSSALEAAEAADADTLIVVPDAPDGVLRVSRSYAGLIGRKGTALLISGAEKREMVRQAQSGRRPELPVAGLMQRVPDLKVFELDGAGHSVAVGH